MAGYIRTKCVIFQVETKFGFKMSDKAISMLQNCELFNHVSGETVRSAKRYVGYDNRNLKQ